MALSREVKTGIVVTLGISFVIYGLNFLKGRNLLSSQRKYHSVYRNIGGLLEGNPVQINGFKVGIISQIHFFPDTSGRIVVTFTLNEKEIKIPSGSIAKIISSDLLGSKAVEILLGKESGYLSSGDTLPSDLEDDLKAAVNKQIAPLQKKAEGLISSIDSVMVVVQTVLNKNARENLTESFENIRKAIETFEKTSRRLDTLVASEKYKLSAIFTKVDNIAGVLSGNSAKLSNVINNFSNISDSLAKADFSRTIQNTNRVLRDLSFVMEKINKGEGSAGLLINNKDLYNRLDSASSGLDKLLADLKENPHRYVHFSIFGRKEKKKKSKPGR